jgi:hypothetical protein
MLDLKKPMKERFNYKLQQEIKLKKLISNKK